MQQIIPITTLLLGALLVLLVARLVQRWRLSTATALSLSLCGVALGLALIPANWRMWLAGGETGDRALTFARELGLTGLFFLAGTRFDPKEAWQSRRVSSFVAGTVALLFVTAVIALTLFGQNRTVAITAAAAIVGASLWLPGQLSLSINKGGTAAAPTKTSGAALALLSLAVLHSYSVFYALSGRAMTGSAWTIVALYEVVKLVVFFSFAYFAASQLLARAEGCVSQARTLIGYVLIAVLIFVLALSVVGQLGALAWAFVSGAVLSRSETGRMVGGSDRPVAIAVLLSFALFPPLLQAHGRRLTDAGLVIIAVVVALTCKFAAVWVGARVGGASGTDAVRITSAALASGEAAVVILGFGMTRWVIDSQFYFGILVYAFVSLLVGPVLWRFVRSFDRELTEIHLTEAPGRPHAPRRHQMIASLVLIGVSLSAFAPVARGQSPAATEESDPVKRAMTRIQRAVDDRAAAAERVLAAEQLVKESIEAKKQGKHDHAIEALEQAEKIVAEARASKHNFLADDLMRRIADERSALNPKPLTPTFQPLPTAWFGKAIPRLVLARYSEYRDTFAHILEEEKVPPQVLAVALVESGFNPLALSPKGARGIWQLMPATAARYGLDVQPANDHRTHPEHSTRAAARYLRDLYQQFGDWKLALAAYNTGERRVQQIIDRTGIRDFDEMARRSLLPLETRNYVPAVLAAWAQMSEVNGGDK